MPILYIGKQISDVFPHFQKILCKEYGGDLRKKLFHNLIILVCIYLSIHWLGWGVGALPGVWPKIVPIVQGINQGFADWKT